MFTQRCILNLKSGQTIQAEAVASSPDDVVKIAYSGAVSLLPRIHETGDVASLRVFFENLSEELGADLQTEEAGEFDRWAL